MSQSIRPRREKEGRRVVYCHQYPLSKFILLRRTHFHELRKVTGTDRNRVPQASMRSTGSSAVAALPDIDGLALRLDSQLCRGLPQPLRSGAEDNLPKRQ